MQQQHSGPPLARLPVGFERFHRRSFVNYQLNRAHALGYAERDELRQAAASIRSQDDCVAVFKALAAQAEGEGRLRRSFPGSCAPSMAGSTR